MTRERKRDVDAAVQGVIDDVTTRAPSLSPVQVHTALASGLASIGVFLPGGELGAWSRAIAEGERIRARDHYC